MSEPLHVTTTRDFLRDHPEYVPDVRWVEVEGRQELVMNTDATIAFADWTIRTGRGDSRKARAFRALLKLRYGR